MFSGFEQGKLGVTAESSPFAIVCGTWLGLRMYLGKTAELGSRREGPERLAMVAPAHWCSLTCGGRAGSDLWIDLGGHSRKSRIGAKATFGPLCQTLCCRLAFGGMS